MLPREFRLKKKKDFDNVFKNGKGYKENFLLLKVAANNLPGARVGFVVSHRISNKAVLRNKIRRRLASLTAERIKNEKGKDFLFITLPGIEKKSFKELKEILEKLFKKAEVW